MIIQSLHFHFGHNNGYSSDISYQYYKNKLDEVIELYKRTINDIECKIGYLNEKKKLDDYHRFTLGEFRDDVADFLEAIDELQKIRTKYCFSGAEKFYVPWL